MNRPTPKQPSPELTFHLLEGDAWNLAEQTPDHFTLLVFYRGLHCPLCKKYLQQLQDLLPQFESRGVRVIAVSMDSEKRARISRQKWELTDLTLGYGLTEKAARDWSLYLSSGVKDGESEVFSEPGLFLVDNTNKIYYSAINSNPWGRPYLPSFVKAVDYIISADYPARGEKL
jgi:peroxiredoxin